MFFELRTPSVALPRPPPFPGPVRYGQQAAEAKRRQAPIVNREHAETNGEHTAGHHHPDRSVRIVVWRYRNVRLLSGGALCAVTGRREGVHVARRIALGRHRVSLPELRTGGVAHMR